MATGNILKSHAGHIHAHVLAMYMYMYVCDPKQDTILSTVHSTHTTDMVKSNIWLIVPISMNVLQIHTGEYNIVYLMLPAQPIKFHTWDNIPAVYCVLLSLLVWFHTVTIFIHVQ